MPTQGASAMSTDKPDLRFAPAEKSALRGFGQIRPSCRQQLWECPLISALPFARSSLAMQQVGNSFSLTARSFRAKRTVLDAARTSTDAAMPGRQQLQAASF